MDELKKLTGDIWDELDGAKHYALTSLHHRSKGDIMNANTFASMARQELEHAENLHKMADRIVATAKAEDKMRGDLMETVWNWERDKMLNKSAKIRAMLDSSK